MRPRRIKIQIQAIAFIKFVVPVWLGIISGCFAIEAQSPACSLKVNELKPVSDLYGLHLGMTSEDVKKALPLVEFGRADRLGAMRTSFNPHFDPRVATTAFPDVRTISLDFLDNKLATVWIGYESSFKWPKLDDFVANFSKFLGVPSDWPIKRNTHELSCDGFSLTAQMIAGGPSLRINDEAAQELARARLAEAIDADEKQVVGDTQTKRYYPSDCSGKDSIPQNTRAVFKTKEEAEKAGFTLSKDCQ